MATAFNSTLGFNAATAFSTLKRLRSELLQYTADLGKVVTASNQYNKAAANLNKITSATSFIAVSQGIRAVGSAFRSAITDARDFEIQLAQIQTISQEFQRAGIEEVGRTVSDLAGQFGQPIEGVAEGLYQALSNQIGTTTETVQFLTEALEFGRGAIVSTADSVDLLSGVLNSYNLTASSTSKISDQLFKTIELGRVTGDELANTIGRVLPLANSLGVRFSEVAASLAELTIQGVNAADAETQLTNVFLKLIRPTEALQGEFDKLGIASAEAGIAAFGLQGFLIKLTEEVGTTASGVGELFNQIRGTRGVIGLVATNAERYADTLKQIETASEGASEAASKLIRSTPAGELTAELEKVRAFLVNDFGRSALKSINDFVQAIGGAETIVIGLKVALTAIVGTGFLIFVNQATNALILLSGAALTAGTSLGTLFAIGAVVALPILITAAAVKMADLSRNTQEAADSVRALEKANKAEADAAIKAGAEQIASRQSLVRESVKGLQEQLFTAQRLYNKDKENAIQAQKGVNESFKRQLAERESLLERFVSVLGNLQSKAADTIKGLNQEFADFKISIEGARFDRQLKGLNEQAQVTALLSRSNQLLAEARRVAASGDADQAKQLIQEAGQLANRAADLGAGRAAGEAQVNKVLSERKALNDQLVAQTKQQAAEAAKIEEKQRAIVDQTVQQISEFNDLQAKLASGKGFANQEEAIKDTTRLRDLALEIQQNLGKVSLGNLGNVRELQEILSQLQKPFTSPTSGKPVKLTFAVDDAISDVFSKLTESSRRQPPELFVAIKALTGKDLDIVGGFGEAQSEIAKLSTQTQAAIENTQNIDNTKAALKSATESVLQFGDAFIRTLDGIGPRVAAAQGPFGDFKQAIDTLKVSATESGNQLRELVNAGLQAANTGDAGALKGILDQLRGIEEAAKTSSEAATLGDFGAGSALAAQAQQLQAALIRVAQSRAQLDAEVKASEQVAANESLINNAQTRLNAVSLGFSAIQNTSVAAGDAARNAQTVIASTAATGQAALAAETAQARELEAALRAAGAARTASGPTQGLARGGFVKYLANGGFTPRGTDTQPAMLSPGEFVMPADMTRKFYAQLTAMRAGRQPHYMQDGGPVSNTFGDININIGPREAKSVDGRRLAQQLQRELRRKTIRSF